MVICSFGASGTVVVAALATIIQPLGWKRRLPCPTGRLILTSMSLAT
jgi:hypothetical protein